MSKPGKSLKRLCKKLGVRLTVKRGKKRVYKSIAVLKSQCRKKLKKHARQQLEKMKKEMPWWVKSKMVSQHDAYLSDMMKELNKNYDLNFGKKKKVKKKKKKVKGRRRFGTGSADEIDIPNLVNVFSPDPDFNYELISPTDLEQNTNYKFTILGTDFQQGLQGMVPSIKQGKYIGHHNTSIIIQFDDGETENVPSITILEVHDLDNVKMDLTGGTNTYLQSPQMQMMYHVLQNMHANPAMTFPEAQQQYLQTMGLSHPPLGANDGPSGPGTFMMYGEDGAGYYFGKRKKKVVKKKNVSATLKRLCKKHKVRLTVKRGKKRVYKSEKVLKKQCKNKMKKKK